MPRQSFKVARTLTVDGLQIPAGSPVEIDAPEGLPITRLAGGLLGGLIVPAAEFQQPAAEIATPAPKPEAPAKP